MSLASMPTEILQLICRFMLKMHYPGGSETFAKLARCCQLLNMYVSPYIYQRVSVGPKASFLLLRSILEKPSLALDIKELTIHACPKGFEGIDLGKACTLLRKPDLLPKRCTRHLHPSDEDVIFALLIEALSLQMSQVQELSIEATAIGEDVTLFDKKRWRSDTPSLQAQLYPNLNEVSIHTHITSNDKRDIFAQFQNLLAVSEPSNLYIEIPHFLFYTSTDHTLPSLQKLELSCEGMTSWALEDLLDHCPNVRALSYDGGSGDGVPDDAFDEMINARDVCEIIERRQHLLQSLAIHYYYGDEAWVEYQDTIPDLSQWLKLKELQLDAEALEDVEPGLYVDTWEVTEVAFLDKLPRSIESVRIFRADDRHVKELKSLARRKTVDFPNWRTLTLEWWNGEEQEPPADLKPDLAAAGIELLIQ